MSLKEQIKERLTKKAPTRVFSYIHMHGRLGVLLEIESNTDFGLKTKELERFAHDVCLQIAAMDPVAIEASDDTRAQAKTVIEPELKMTRSDIYDKVFEGKLAKWEQEHILLSQPWIKDRDVTIGDLLTELRDDMRENVQIVRFARFGE